MSSIEKLTPEQMAPLNQEHESVLNHVFEVLNDKESWKPSSKTVPNEIEFFYRTDPKSPYGMVKSIVHIPAPMDVVLSVLDPVSEIDDQTPKEQRHGFNYRHVLYSNPDEETQPMVFMVSLPSGSFAVSPRQFFLYRRHYIRDGKHVYLHATPTVECPGVTTTPMNGNVIGKMLMQGYVAEPDTDENHQNEIKLTYFCHLDPAGNVPSFVYNMAVENQGYAAKGTKKAVLSKLAK